ncbi:MAG: hypothetical protein M3N16_02400, partial [Actinomycetota bacterium]|nr:hypothetical protein [Actinomycetota bacterium]
MRKEVRAVTEHRACDICGRSILKGEHTEAYLAPGGERKVVCELCTAHASRMDWIVESAHGELPVTGRRSEPRRSIWARLTGRPENGGAAAGADPAAPSRPGRLPDRMVPDRGPSGDGGP